MLERPGGVGQGQDSHCLQKFQPDYMLMYCHFHFLIFPGFREDQIKSPKQPIKYSIVSPCNCLEHFTSLISHLLCRVCLLLMLATCLGGAWVLEQPGGSALEFYPTFRWLITRLIAIDGVKSVWDLVAEGFQLHINHRHQLPHFLKKSLHLWPRFPGSIGRCLGLELKLPSLNMPMPIHHQSGCSRTLKVAVYTKRSSKVT